MTTHTTKTTKPIPDKQKALSHYTSIYLDVLLEQLLQDGLSIQKRLKLSEDLRRLRSDLYKIRAGQGGIKQ